jgi:hypothetical protein
MQAGMYADTPCSIARADRPPLSSNRRHLIGSACSSARAALTAWTNAAAAWGDLASSTLWSPADDQRCGIGFLGFKVDYVPTSEIFVRLTLAARPYVWLLEIPSPLRVLVEVFNGVPHCLGARQLVVEVLDRR